MYNRYIRNDAGVYQRVTVPDGPPPGQGPPPPPPPEQGPLPGGGDGPPPPRGGGSGPGGSPPKRGFLSGLLSRLRLDEMDTGDLLLLLIIFLLFKDGEDEEMLIALGLLRIL